MALRFKLQDRVRLTRTAVSLYGGAWPHWVPEGQGGGAPGTVVIADENRPHDPRAAARPYLVQWDNGITNSYREDDLEAAEESCEAPCGTFEDVQEAWEDTGDIFEDTADEDTGTNPGNILPFRR